MSPRFDLPDVVIAERLGRALIEAHPPQRGERWVVLAECSFLGAGALAGARLLSACGAAVEVRLLSQDAESCSAFATHLEVVGAMDLPIALGVEGLGAEARVVLGGTPPPGISAPGTVDLADFDPLDALHPRLPGTGPETLLHEPGDAAGVWSVDEVRALDAAAIDEYGLPGVCLMENAGAGAAAVTRQMLGTSAGPVAILAGPGNNGGDGFVVVRELLCAGVDARVGLLSPREKVGGDAAINLEILEAAGVEIATCDETPEKAEDLLDGAALAVDALLGTGLSGEVREPARSMVQTLNRADVPVLSLDAPTGIRGDTGEVLGVAVRADTTVTFAAVKAGLHKGDGPGYAGRLVLADIGAPGELLQRKG